MTSLNELTSFKVGSFWLTGTSGASLACSAAAGNVGDDVDDEDDDNEDDDDGDDAGDAFNTFLLPLLRSFPVRPCIIIAASPLATIDRSVIRARRIGEASVEGRGVSNLLLKKARVSSCVRKNL